MGKSQRSKGKRGERLLAEELRQMFPEYAESIRRGWQSRLGDDDPDVIFPGCWFEHKFGALPNPRGALAQATKECKGRGLPIAVIRDNRKPPFAVMWLGDFLPLLRKSMGLAMLVKEEKNGVANEGRRNKSSKRAVVFRNGKWRIRTVRRSK